MKGEDDIVPALVSIATSLAAIATWCARNENIGSSLDDIAATLDEINTIARGGEDPGPMAKLGEVP